MNANTRLRLWKEARALLPVTGILSVAMGAAWFVPAAAEWLDRGAFERRDYAVVSVGLVLILGGVFAIACGFRSLRLGSMPAPVRAVITANGLFLSFCALEFSDGLLRQGGRVFYWTSVLFLPALVVFCGQVLGKRWAWWVARAVAAFAITWFVGIMLLIPFAELRGSGGIAVPWYGRVYMAGVSLLFASVSAYAFRSLGHAEAKEFYGVAYET
jgi:hypothetical protein